MKVILSRKGLESHANPIIKNSVGIWKYHPLPVPSENSEIKYSDIFLYDDIKVSDFLNNVAPRSKKYNYCEINPDLKKDFLKKRSPYWKSNFSRRGKAQLHLDSHQIRKGDIILFFGWFKKAEIRKGKFKYIKDKDYPNGFHAIYGYFQISEIWKPNKEKTPKWLEKHPTVKCKNQEKLNSDNNTIYTAEDYFNYPRYIRKSGSGIFNFRDNLIITKKGQSKRSLWELPIQLHPNSSVSLSFHSFLNWTLENNRAILQSGIAQEFVFTDIEAIVEKWCINLIRDNNSPS